jgi:hypothetical protein
MLIKFINILRKEVNLAIDDYYKSLIILLYNVTVPPYCPTACDTSITYFSLMALEARIPILSQLQGKKLNRFKDQAGFRLYPVSKTFPEPVCRYIFSWKTDGSQRELARKPSWQNFIQVLKEIDLPMGELAKQIEDFFIQTCPAGPQQKKGTNLCFS